MRSSTRTGSIIVTSAVPLDTLSPAGIKCHHEWFETGDSGGHDAGMKKDLGADRGVDDGEKGVGVLESAIEVYLSGDSDYNDTAI